MKHLTYLVCALGVLALLGAGFAVRELTYTFEVKPQPAIQPEHVQTEPPLGAASGQKVCTTTTVNISASTSTNALASSTARTSARLVNDSSSLMWFKRGANVSSGTGLPLLTNGAEQWDDINNPYDGLMTAISSNGTGTLRVEECKTLF